jgi:radical SAM protein with 4Fe4S-binding SPASM domain
MPTDKIIDVMDQAQAMGFNGLVNFHFYSEPLLDRRNIAFAREARERGMQPYMHTNGDVLVNNDELCATVSDLYEYIVIGIYDYASDAELDAVKQFWRAKLPSADLRFSTVGDFDAVVAKSMGIPRAFVPTDKRFGLPDLTFANGPCSRPLIRLILRHDGEMCFCCEDMKAEFDLGNVHDASLEELWYSDKHVRLVESLLEGHRDRHGLCRSCPLFPTGHPSDGQSIRIKKRNIRMLEET